MSACRRFPIHFKKSVRTNMNADQKDMAAKIEAWIAAGRKPEVAHWHGALEATMASFKPHLQPGHLIPVQALDKKFYAVFAELYALLDLSPDVQAAFLPTAMGGVLKPPPALDTLRRVNPDNTSTLLLCRRPGRQPRILCAEISKEAWKPGVDLFEEGALIGSYEYDTSADCIRDLAKLIRTHLWRKEKWSADHYRDYTLNWFARLADTGRVDAPVQPDHSYVHTPELLNLDRVAAIFKLVHARAVRQLQETKPDPAGQRGRADAPQAEAADNRRHYLEGRVLNLLNYLRDSEAVDFSTFMARENDQFKNMFAETVTRLEPLLGGLR